MALKVELSRQSPFKIPLKKFPPKNISYEMCNQEKIMKIDQEKKETLMKFLQFDFIFASSCIRIEEN
jgi:hypothetical protein